jgi:DNA-binding MarR family transcriptional regulator
MNESEQISKDENVEAGAREAQEEAFFTTWEQLRQQIMGANFRQTHQQGTSMTQFMVLAVLHRAHHEGRRQCSQEQEEFEPCTIGSLAEQLDLDPATVVRAVDSLEKRGTVARRRDTQDRRQVFVEFTEQGRVEQQAMHQRFKARLLTIFHEMSEDGRVNLLHGLQEFVTIGTTLQQQEG